MRLELKTSSSPRWLPVQPKVLRTNFARCTMLQPVPVNSYKSNRKELFRAIPTTNVNLSGNCVYTMKPTIPSFLRWPPMPGHFWQVSEDMLYEVNPRFPQKEGNHNLLSKAMTSLPTLTTAISLQTTTLTTVTSLQTTTLTTGTSLQTTTITTVTSLQTTTLTTVTSLQTTTPTTVTSLQTTTLTMVTSL